METLWRRINGGKGVVIYQRQYELPDYRLITRQETAEVADYAAPIAKMTNQTRHLQKRQALDALSRNKDEISNILAQSD